MATGDPLSFDLNDEDVKLFCEESDEQIAILDEALVQLEGQPAPELVQQIFRAAHTLKGSAGCFAVCRGQAVPSSWARWRSRVSRR